MKKWLGLVACLGLMALPAAAQFKGVDTPSFEIGGGYAYRSFDAPNFPNANYDVNTTNASEPRMAMNGFFVTVGYNLNGFIGVVSDFDWTHVNAPDDLFVPGNDSFSSLMVGPQIYPIGHHKITPFAHVEFGLAHFREDLTNVDGYSGCGSATIPPDGASTFPCVATDGSFAVDAGGGVDVSLTHNFAVRLGEFDWDQTRMFEPGAATGNTNQNNWKVKAGIIIRLGGK
ncbi:MAG TPA: outer membrane beta-barrel protein [Candidatus Aquilonibacter sp.]|nr:outer membrane beta-barrel protein [Candidatus Aquilonibacter sp.]